MTSVGHIVVVGITAASIVTGSPLGARALAQASSQPLAAPDAEPDPIVAMFGDRLEALSPSDPTGYLELGEEVAGVGEAGLTDLARRLFVLSMTSALEVENRAIAGGACLALAELAFDERERGWLLDMAVVIDPRIAPPERSPREPTRADIDASIALTMVRAGEGRAARRALENEQVRASIAAHASEAWLTRVLNEADRWPCPSCHNQRVIDDPDRPGGRLLCPVCAGNPGPALTRGELLEHLHVEAALLGVRVDSWAAQLSLGLDEPLREADPRSIAARYRVDPALACWRGGRWVACPDAESAP